MSRLLICFASILFCTSAWGTTIQLDLGGFPNTTGGQVSGPGYSPDVLKFPPGPGVITLDKLAAGGTYSVDFYHNSGKASSDFLLTINADGAGVESVTKGGGTHEMIVDFKPGATTLKLRTFPIVFNSDGSHTGQYHISGLLAAYKLSVSSGPQTFVAIPGIYSVDNLQNSGNRNEDYQFIVSDTGELSSAGTNTISLEDGAFIPGPDTNEFVAFNGNAIRVRAALVRIRIESPRPVACHSTFPSTRIKWADGAGEFEELMIVGCAGANIWSFGPSEVTASNFIRPDRRPWIGAKTENDFLFLPWLRYDLEKKEFYFLTIDGPSRTATAEVKGMLDDKITPLEGVKITATIVQDDATPAATQPAPATQPAAP